METCGGDVTKHLSLLFVLPLHGIPRQGNIKPSLVIVGSFGIMKSRTGEEYVLNVEYLLGLGRRINIVGVMLSSLPPPHLITT